MASCGFEVAGIEGDVIDFEITANRPDCLSIRGLAREAATAFEKSPESPESPESSKSAESSNSPRSASVLVAIESEACGRYALLEADVTVAASPQWMASRLNACGIRPINNIVD